MKNNQDRRHRERREFRLRVLDAARDLFAANGESAVTLRKVAERVEYSPTAIYLHFPNKRTLIEELCAEDFEVYARRFKQAERVADPVESLKKVATAYIDFGLLNPWHYRTVFMSSRKSGGEEGSEATASVPLATAENAPEANPGGVKRQSPLSISHTVYGFIYSAAFKTVAAGCTRAEYRDPHQISQVIWCGLHGIISLHLLRSNHPGVPWRPVERTSSMMSECLLRGILRDQSGE